MKMAGCSSRGLARWKAVVSVIIPLLLLSSCTPVPNSATPRADGLSTSPASMPATNVRAFDPIKISFQPIISFSPVLIAQEEGYFEKYGLDAEFVPVGSANEAVPLVMQGQLDVVQIALNPGFFNAIAKGGTARVAMGLTRWSVNGCAAIALASRRADTARFQDPAQWKGAKLVTDPVGERGLPGLLLERIAGQYGAGPGDIMMVKLPLANTAEALKNGAVDLVLISEPWLTRVISAADAEVLVTGKDILPEGQSSVVVFSERLLQNRDLGMRVAQAYLEGLRQYQAGNTDRNVAIVAQYTQLEPELIKRVCWATLPADGSLNMDSIMEYQAWAVKQGHLDQVVAPTDFWDGQLLQQAQSARQEK